MGAREGKEGVEGVEMMGEAGRGGAVFWWGSFLQARILYRASTSTAHTAPMRLLRSPSKAPSWGWGWTDFGGTAGGTRAETTRSPA